jgi:pantetheine-phosphate adenylyltransferase
MNSKKDTLGFYAGSFSPFHVGHLNIILQAKNVFSSVVVAQGKNPEKTILDTYKLPQSFLASRGILVDQFDGLLSDRIAYWETTHNYNVTLVRGLRSGADLEYEQNFAAFLKSMCPSVKIVAFYCDPLYRHISSSALRGIQKLSDAEYKKYAISDDF